MGEQLLKSMTLGDAIAALGEKHWEWAVQQGGAYCARKAITVASMGMPRIGEAYRIAEQVANQTASARV